MSATPKPLLQPACSPLGRRAASSSDDAGAARGSAVRVAVLVRRVLRALARALPLELGAEALALRRAELLGLVARDVRRRDRAGLVRVGQGDRCRIHPSRRARRPSPRRRRAARGRQACPTRSVPAGIHAMPGRGAPESPAARGGPDDDRARRRVSRVRGRRRSRSRCATSTDEQPHERRERPPRARPPRGSERDGFNRPSRRLPRGARAPSSSAAAPCARS